MAAFDVIIPAMNEAQTIAGVIAAALGCAGVGRVIVVDDHSSDATGRVAVEAGATVVQSAGRHSKATALATGVASSESDVLVFFDADILGVTTRHFEALADPVIHQGQQMCCGLVDYGPMRSRLFLRLPPITGLRAVRRNVFEAIPASRLNGFQIEIMINEVIARGRMPSSIRVLSGTGHRSKVSKAGLIRGSWSHLSMTLELLHCFTFVPLWTYGAYLEHLTVLTPAV